MKKILALFLFVFSFLTIQAQTPRDSVIITNPQNFIEMTTIDTAYAQIISRKANLNRRINLQTLKDWILTGVSGIDSVYLSGDTLNILQGLTLWSVPLAPASDGNGFFSAANNNDTIRVSTALLRAAFQITGGAYGMTVTSARTGSNATMVITNSSSGRGLSATSTSGTAIVGSGVYGVYGIGNTYGLWGYSASGGYAVYGNSIGSLGGYFASQYTSANDVQPSLRLDRITSGTATAGIGNSIDFYNSTTTNLRRANRIASVWSTATEGSQSSRFEIYGANNAVEARKMAIASTGQLTLDGYAANALNNVDSSLYVLAVDATGDVHTRAASGLGGDGNGIIDALPVGNVSIDADSNNLEITKLNRVYFEQDDGVSYFEFSKSGGFPYFELLISDGFSTSSYVNIDLLAGLQINHDSLITLDVDNTKMILTPRVFEINQDTIDATGVTTFLGFPGGSDDQTLSTSRDTITIADGNSVRTPGIGFLRDSITGAALTIDLKKYGSAVVEIRMESCTATTLTVNNPWSALDIDNTYPTFEGETGVYTFHFLSGAAMNDQITWPANFLDSNGTALGTDTLIAGTMYTCYYNPVSAKYYCK